MSDLDFLKAVNHTINLYEETTGHAANRTRQMIDRYGVAKALSRLMISADLQQGFKAWGSNQLNKTFESLVVTYQHLFSPEVVEAA